MKKIILCTFLISILSLKAQELPNGFVYLSDIDTTIHTELRYLTTNNFIGQPINGYHKNCVIVTKATALALKKIQHKLLKKGLSLKIFDAYRPQKAVTHFVTWARDLEDTVMKHTYYPKIPKQTLFKRGYISSRSGHSRGSTVDLTIINNNTKKELDMGSPFDFFGISSHYAYNKLSKKQKENRTLLRTIMTQHNFRPYKFEWWHFTLRFEPFPKTYFNFNVE